MFKESASIGHILPMPIPPKIADTCRYRLIGTSLLPTMLLPGPDLHCVGPLVLWDIRNILQANTGEDQKKF